ncbi:ATP-dependent DNA helicase DinG [Arsukibacterium tuosuense]|uniref:ATP-dependent DNA helicase DinG n=1 Tax=Arsukibacterium tuosuense TaxID=1323745 RepID=A0A285J4Z2_9GAMM|nr:ATP-dependent DNA helicase DinG [Arsukibacterium tuosuense]SNY55282.1 ATP-dependent DNA helicase DinG [Arsukibacterium tuosuense]
MSTEQMLSEKLKQQIRDAQQQLKTALPNYHNRPGQNKLIAEMANIVAGQYHRHDRIGLVEAGTGTGKSLAYLLATLPLALAQNKKLVIATATVALQEQLVNKDIPFFRQHSGIEFEYNLVKGRSRYACIERLKQQLIQPDLLTSAERSQVALLDTLSQAWQQRSWLGDRDTLPTAVDDALWHSISADPYHCSKHDKRHQHCPFHLARAEISDARLLVVNHSLLLADLAGGNAILPAPEDCIYVIDEAHHLPACGRDYFAAFAQLSQPQLWLEKLGVLANQLIQTLPETSLKDLLKLDDSRNELLSLLKPVERSLNEWQSRWFTDTNQTDYRFEHAALPTLWQQQAEPIASCAQKTLTLLDKISTEVAEVALSPAKRKSQSKLLQELSQLAQKLEQQQALWQLYAQPQTEPAYQARWVVKDEQQQLTAHACPLSVANTLEQLLFSQAYACILCSATLTVLNSFDHIKYELGLTAHPGLQTVRVDSPFAYQQNGVIILPKMQNEPTASAYTDELISLLPDYLPNQQGSLVLFASYWQMQQVAEALRKKGLSLLVQGEASRQALLSLHNENCQHNKTSILFGTQSFSEGLDLPGKLLTNLVITKLPFAVPTSPLEAAMSEAVTRKGGNPFVQLAIPATARKLVQACGRLLRQEQDQGRIVILDRRLVTKSYGKAMLDTLPPFRRQIDY